MKLKRNMSTFSDVRFIMAQVSPMAGCQLSFHHICQQAPSSFMNIMAITKSLSEAQTFDLQAYHTH